jgi:hypothetical protein
MGSQLCPENKLRLKRWCLGGQKVYTSLLKQMFLPEYEKIVPNIPNDSRGRRGDM